MTAAEYIRKAHAKMLLYVVGRYMPEPSVLRRTAHELWFWGHTLPSQLTNFRPVD